MCLVMTKAFVLALVVLAMPTASHAQAPSTGSVQAYPTKPIRLILPFPSGGVGTSNHLTAELLKSVAAIDIVHEATACRA